MSFEIISYNVHGFIARRRGYRPSAYFDYFIENDWQLMALQEVLIRIDQLASWKEKLAKKGLNLYFFPTQERGEAMFGNALLGKFSLSDFEVTDVSFSTYEPRQAISTGLEFNEGHLNLAVTHLGLSKRERGHQIQCLKDLAINKKLDFLVGDFNSPWLTQEWLKKFWGKRWGVKRGASFPVWMPMLSLDQIWYNRDRWGCTSFEVIKNSTVKQLSDHLPVKGIFREKIFSAYGAN